MFIITYGTRTGPVRDPQGWRTAPLRTRKGIDPTIIGKNPARASYLAVRGPYGPLRPPHGLFTGCLQYLNPYGARRLIMHAFKLYGPRTGRQNSYGAARGLCGPREWTYDFCSKQPGNSTGPGSVMWLRLKIPWDVKMTQPDEHINPRWPGTNRVKTISYHYDKSTRQCLRCHRIKTSMWPTFIVTYNGKNTGRKEGFLIARFMVPTWGPSEADRTQVGPMLAPWILLSRVSPTRPLCHRPFRRDDNIRCGEHKKKTFVFSIYFKHLRQRR